MYEYRKEKGIKLDDVSGFIYILESTNGIYKIGNTTGNINLRITQIALDLFGKLGRIGLYKCFKMNNIREVEKYLHEKYKKNKVTGEWFRLSNDELSEIETCLAALAPDRFQRAPASVIPLQSSFLADVPPATTSGR